MIKIKDLNILNKSDSVQNCIFDPIKYSHLQNPNMSNSITPLSELGLFGLIEKIAQRFPAQQASTVVGIGQDAAVLQPGGHQVVTSSHLMLEGIHFDLTYFPLPHLGYKAVVAGISDIIATGARPSQISISLGVSGKISLQAVELLMDGVALACEKYHLDLVGFRPTSSLTGLSIGVTAIGFGSKEALFSRHTAKPNDLICVTGDLGAAYMGLQLLEREKKILSDTSQEKPDFGSFEYLLQRQLRPEARLNTLDQIRESGLCPTSMTLVRESLAASLLHICKASDTGCQVYESKIPLDHTTIALGEEMSINPMVAALNGGEDYELLFTLSLNDYEKVIKKSQLKEVFVIGHLTETGKGYTFETNAGEEVPLQAQGWGNKA